MYKIWKYLEKLKRGTYLCLKIAKMPFYLFPPFRCCFTCSSFPSSWLVASKLSFHHLLATMTTPPLYHFAWRTWSGNRNSTSTSISIDRHFCPITTNGDRMWPPVYRPATSRTPPNGSGTSRGCSGWRSCVSCSGSISSSVRVTPFPPTCRVCSTCEYWLGFAEGFKATSSSSLRSEGLKPALEKLKF